MAEITSHTEMTLDELNLFAMHHRKIDYTLTDAQQLVSLVRKYINPRTPTCMTCHSNLRDAKTEANTFYLLVKDKVSDRLAQQAAEQDIVAETSQNQPKTAKVNTKKK